MKYGYITKSKGNATAAEREKMTMFEELCKDMGICKDSEAEKCMSNIVDDLLFDEIYRPDEELISEAKKRFLKNYK